MTDDEHKQHVREMLGWICVGVWTLAGIISGVFVAAAITYTMRS